MTSGHFWLNEDAGAGLRGKTASRRGGSTAFVHGDSGGNRGIAGAHHYQAERGMEMIDGLRFWGGVFLGMGIISQGGPKVVCFAISLVAALCLAAVEARNRPL